MAADYEMVRGDELMDGDIVIEGIDDGGPTTDHCGRWNMTVVRLYKGELGHGELPKANASGWGGWHSWRPEPRFAGSRVFKVKSPRPRPKANEFGPICP